MAVYRTCFGCVQHPGNCVTRDAMRAKLKGLNITSLKWKCADRKSRYPIGSPVWFETVYDQQGDSDEYGIPQETYPAIVVEDLGSKALIFVKPGERPRGDDSDDALLFVPRNNGFCKVPVLKLKPRDGAIEKVCRSCNNPVSVGHQYGYRCHPETASWWEINDMARDGRTIRALYADGEEDRVRWQEERYCMLGAPQGSAGPGFVSVENNLPVDEPTHWMPG